MHFSPQQFYLFSAAHSFLIGLLPFFIPVILWRHEFSIAAISLFIAIGGASFIAALRVWDYLRYQQGWNRILITSFILEVILVALLINGINHLSFILLAIINGLYNCFYWSTQRAAFNAVPQFSDTGKAFGNFQILVLIVLKAGIFIGAYLLEAQQQTALLLLSALGSGIATLLLLQKSARHSDPTASQPTLSVPDILNFKDPHCSKYIFLLDGPFLFLESYLWLLSLYLLTGSSFFNLGVTVILLSVVLSLLFYFIKNTIDRSHQRNIFLFAIAAYALSWLLRGHIESFSTNALLYPTILFIAFMTSFFRLVFNKRFFDTSRKTQSYQYLIIKSYYSQFGILVFFMLFALVSASYDISLSTLYYTACPVAFLYTFYLANRLKKVSSKNETIKL